MSLPTYTIQYIKNTESLYSQVPVALVQTYSSYGDHI